MTDTDVLKWKGVAIGIYLMNGGDIITRHQHAWDHTIYLVKGEGEFEIYDLGITKMELRKIYLLPKEIDHEIRSLSDNTIMVATSDDQGIKLTVIEPPPRRGGVLMADGTIIPHVEIA